jgi:putative transposase
MGWEETDPVEERMKFVLAAGALRNMAALCRRFGISRKTGYKWLSRYELEGVAGLEERDRAPHQHGRKSSQEMEDRLLEARKRHRTWGPKKIHAWLLRKEPDLELPAISTIGSVLKRNGMVDDRRLRRKHEVVGGPVRGVEGPNDAWNCDYKGQFRLGNGEECYPLTITDASSRFLICCRAYDGIRWKEAWEGFERAFREFGLPKKIHSDNGAPFASNGLAGLSRLAIRFLKLGIGLDRSRPAHPEDNGGHERFHWTLKKDTALPPAQTLRGQQRKFDTFNAEYNYERPHEALGMKSPGDVYRPASRVYPTTMPSPEYPGHYEVRRVTCSGNIKWKGRFVYVSDALENEPVGLVETKDAVFDVYYGSMQLGAIDETAGLQARKARKVLPM